MSSDEKISHPTEENLSQENQGTHRQAQTQALKCRILIVEDNEAYAELLAILLEKRGHEVFVAHDGPTALELSVQHLPQVILQDLNLPGMDGLEVAREIRKNPSLDHTVLIALSGYDREFVEEKIKKAGIDHHLLKPVCMDTLQELLKQISTRH